MLSFLNNHILAVPYFEWYFNLCYYLLGDSYFKSLKRVNLHYLNKKSFYDSFERINGNYLVEYGLRKSCIP